MYLLLLVLDPGSGAVGDPFLTIGLPIIVVAVLAILIVLVSIILLTRFYRRFVFIIIIRLIVVFMLCLPMGNFILILAVFPLTSNDLYIFNSPFRRRLKGKPKKVSNLAT